MFIAKRFNDEVLVQADTEQEAIQQLLENYGFVVEETSEEVVTFDGVEILESKKQEILNARAEQLIQNQIEDIKRQLKELDLKSIRALRANDTEYIAQYESEAQALRAEIQRLMGE